MPTRTATHRAAARCGWPARAGNVIGGGDWARDRIVVDCITRWSRGQPVEIRSPRATRPWQHVLEPLSGYLALGAALQADDSLHGESFNFGPNAEQNRNVLDLLNDLARRWRWPAGVSPYTLTADLPFNESSLLKLNCDKAQARLSWTATLQYDECVALVGDWYRHFYQEGQGSPCHALHARTLVDIETFEARARSRQLRWAGSTAAAGPAALRQAA